MVTSGKWLSALQIRQNELVVFPNNPWVLWSRVIRDMYTALVDAFFKHLPIANIKHPIDTTQTMLNLFESDLANNDSK